ncbi:hypothetical protein [Cupriavidus sp. amp6]|uniref:hypothetical protein n=1 Tax=Cupriavidus sp. amp6 TaxID=388051 RepID=UPI000414E99D|nr:hypothetical protein [Cupriavidus sp. amp6]
MLNIETEVSVVCPFDVMSLLEWKGRQSEYFRFIHFDRRGGLLYVMPMGKKPTVPSKCRIARWRYEEVAIRLGTEICAVEDFVRPSFMQEKVTLTEAEDRELSSRQAIILPLISGALARDLGFGSDLIDIYTDEGLRESLVTEAAKRSGVREDFVRHLFYQRIWFGGGERSLMPLYRLRGAPGISRVQTNRRKVGRRREELRGGKLVAVEDVGRVTNHWLEVFRKALKEFYRGSKTSFSFVYEQMVKQLTVVTKIGGISTRAASRAKRRRIPLKKTFHYHAKRLIVEMGLDKKYPPPQIDNTGAKGGHSVDVTFGREVCDIDCTHLELVEVVCLGPEGKYVSAGHPILAFLVDRDSGCIVSWVIWYGRAENNTIYRHLILKAFLTKDEWLNKIGYTGDRSGFVAGRIDAVCPDRGPGFSKVIREMLSEEMRVGVAAPPPRTPEGKPHVEGRFGNFKTMLRWVLRELAHMNGGVITLTRPRGNGRKRERGVVARLTRASLEVLVATGVNIINTRQYRQSHVSRTPISADYKGSTPAGIFVRNQEGRRGDAEVPVDTQNIYKRFLERRPGAICAGKIVSEGISYSSKSLRAYDRAHRSQNGMRLRQGIPTDYYVAPYGNKLIWFTEAGELDMLEPTSVSDEVLETDGVLDEVDMRFRNRIYAATHGDAQQKQPSQRGRLKKASEKVIVDQLAAIGELPENIPRDGAARATLQHDVAREVFDSALEGAGLSVPSLSPGPLDDIATLEEPRRIGRRRRRAEEGAWFRSQQSNSSI